MFFLVALAYALLPSLGSHLGPVSFCLWSHKHSPTLKHENTAPLWMSFCTSLQLSQCTLSEIRHGGQSEKDWLPLRVWHDVAQELGNGTLTLCSLIYRITFFPTQGRRLWDNGPHQINKITKNHILSESGSLQ